MILTLTRNFKSAIKSLTRNGLLTIATAGILMMSLYVVGTAYLEMMATNDALQKIQEKADISIYFKTDVKEDVIFDIKSKLEAYKEIQSVEYISKDQALEDFKRNNANEPVIIDSLKELGENPLLASLVVRAKDPNQYQIIYDEINKSDFVGDIGRINYGKYKDLINKINIAANSAKKDGIFKGLLMTIISILIIFNAVRITIYSHKQEIEIMRLVGASNAYIRLPFIFEGIIYGIIATILSMLLLILTIKFKPSSFVLFGNFLNIPVGAMFSLYISEFWKLLSLQLFIGLVIGISSSWISMRKYLRV